MSRQRVKTTKKPRVRLSPALRAAVDPSHALYTHSQHEQSTVIDTGKQAVIVDGELPKLPEYLREFAFRYALENRSVADWGRIFNVAAATVSRWIQRPEVLKYVMTLRYERRLRIAEMTEQAEGKALKKLNEILDQDITPATIQPLLTTIFRTLSMVREGRVPSEGEAPNYNLTLNTFSDNRQLTVSPEQLEAQLEELDAVESMLTRPRERVVLPAKEDAADS